LVGESGASDGVADQDIEVSVVMPCLNEAETLGTCIEKALRSLKDQGVCGEVIVADNGSTDGSQQIAEGLGARVVAVATRGYGAALMGGFAAGRGKYFIMGDSDDSYNFGEIPKFVRKLREGNDFVVGCRLPRGGGQILPGAMPFLNQSLGTPVLTALSRTFFGTKVIDINCGMRGLTREACQRLNLQTTGMEFASEMIVKAAMLRLKTAEVPITLHPDGRTKPPHLRPWRDGWRHLRFMLLFSPRWLFLFPGLVLFLAGGSVLGLLAFGPFPIGRVTFNTNTQLIAAMTLLAGFQLMTLGVFAKSFAVQQGLMPGGRLDSWARLLRLEAGIIFGLFLFAVGGGLIGRAVWLWRSVDFGPADDLPVIQLLIPAATFVLLGIQMISAGFFLGVIQLGRHPRDEVQRTGDETADRGDDGTSAGGS